MPRKSVGDFGKTEIKPGAMWKGTLQTLRLRGMTSVICTIDYEEEERVSICVKLIGLMSYIVL